MALPSSGTITMSAIKTEFTGPNNLTAYYKGGTYVPNTPANAAVPTSGTIKLTDFYGASSVVTDVVVSDQSYSDTNDCGGGACSGITRYRLNSSGVVEKFTLTANSYSTLETWLIVGSNSDYQSRVTVTSGTLTSGTTNTWQALSTSREWELAGAVGGGTYTDTCIFTIEIRRVSDSVVVDSATITLTINLNNGLEG